MEAARILQSLGVDPRDSRASALAAALGRGRRPPPVDIAWLAAGLALGLAEAPARQAVAPPFVVAVAGGQGSGKTTLAGAVVEALEALGARAAACSLDDFYLRRWERAALAADVHPLLATRGVPGTHDVALLERTIDALGKPGGVRLPVFDKGLDDRLPEDRWRRIETPIDVFVLEGWCVGARADPEASLAEPLNPLEADEDARGVWRRFVNQALAGRYAALWSRIHRLVYLQVPDMAAVTRWRGQQEQALPEDRRMDSAALARFIAHYERITRAMQADLPARADVLVRLGANHDVAEIRRNPPRRGASAG